VNAVADANATKKAKAKEAAPASVAEVANELRAFDLI